jgi:hypothetical protein
VDAAAGECGVADREAESFGDDAEDEAGEESGCEFGGEDARPFGCEQEGRSDGAGGIRLW